MFFHSPIELVTHIVFSSEAIETPQYCSIIREHFGLKCLEAVHDSLAGAGFFGC
jgi:hypothetical protein